MADGSSVSRLFISGTSICSTRLGLPRLADGCTETDDPKMDVVETEDPETDVVETEVPETEVPETDGADGGP